jgi:MFS family permease
MNAQRLFVASCLALITSAFSFQIRGNIGDSLGTEFGLTKENVGWVLGTAFSGMAFAMLVFAPLADSMGLGRVLALAWLAHLLGILGTIFSLDLAALPTVQTVVHTALTPLQGYVSSDIKPGFWVLSFATFLIGAGNGLVEIAINPLAATLFPNDKTKYLNILHAWWPGGLIVSGLLAIYAIPDITLYGFKPWQVKMALLLVPLFLYGVLSVGQTFPATERVSAHVSTASMFLQVLRPMFLILAFCMLLTSSAELAPNQWQEAVLTRTANVSGTMVLVYTSAIMFVMRFFAGPLAHKISPIGILTVSSVLTGAGLYWLSYANTAVIAFSAATLFGIGVAYFWPTMLGVTSERFPKGGAFLLGLMGCIGNLAISQVLPQMGKIYDSNTVAALVREDKSLKNRVLTVPSDQAADYGAKDDKLPLVRDDFKSYLPEKVNEKLFPAGSDVLNPEATRFINDTLQAAKKKKEEGKPVDEKEVQTLTDLQAKLKEPEKEGAAWAFRWVAVLPAVLFVIFSLIMIVDALRGGYAKIVQREHIGDKTMAH